MSLNPSPFVKWAGGKTQLLAQYEPHLPTIFERYIEAFVGGGAVFFHLHRLGRLRSKEVVLIDRLSELINCYHVIQNQVKELIAALRVHQPHATDSAYYYHLRDMDRQPGFSQRGDVERAARFIYLNRTCYNGLYRVNRQGQFNVPFGRYRNPTICNDLRLLAIHGALQGAALEANDFEVCREIARPGDLVYLDPPYHPLSSGAGFTSYTAASFDADDQRRLAQLFRELDHRGCHLMLSNSCTPLVKELYHGYEQIQIRATRAISSKGDGRGSVAELLILNQHERP